MKTATREEERGPGGRAVPEPGSVVYVRYLDHVLVRNADLGAYRPFVRETVGWPDREDGDCVRLVWDRAAGPAQSGKTKQLASGLVILKSAILEMRILGGENYLSQEANSIHHEYTKEEKTENRRNPGNAGNAPAPAFLREEGGDIQRRDKPSAG